MPGSVTLAPPTPIAQIERRLHWRAISTLAFIGVLVFLGAVAWMAVSARPGVQAGLPEDPDVRVASHLVRGRIAVEARPLHYVSALYGATGEATPREAALRIERARAFLARARERRPDDPRLPVALADLDLAAGRLTQAERGYRAIADRGGQYGQAHLGLGVALAMRARQARVPAEARALELQAIAQFAAVRPEETVYEVALYDRAVLLGAVGRDAEAARVRRELERLGGEWAARLLGATQLSNAGR